VQSYFLRLSKVYHIFWTLICSLVCFLHIETLEFNFRFGVKQKKHYQNKLCWFKGNYEKINAQLNKIDWNLTFVKIKSRRLGWLSPLNLVSFVTCCDR
jgi:hypothetical protein